MKDNLIFHIYSGHEISSLYIDFVDIYKLSDTK